jgi:anti-sigma regulatory factor (Ser/Thr protein kinase)
VTLAPLHHTLPAVAESVPRLRHAVVAFAAGCGADDAVLDRLRLAVSEAVTNVIVHAYAGRDEPGAVRLSAALEGQLLRVIVRDDGGGMRPRPDSPGLGLGLPLIAKAAHSLEVHSQPSGGTEMRMCFKLP